MADDDSEAARAARAEERRRQHEAIEQARARQVATVAREHQQGLRRACAPWGWIYDPTISYSIGLGALGAMFAAAYLVIELVPGVTFVGFFDAFGSGSSLWLPLAVVAIAIGVPFALRGLAAPAAERAVDAERAWLASLPFPGPDLPGVARAYARGAHATGGGRLRVSLYFVGAHPPADAVRARLGAASIDAAVSTHDDELRLEISIPGASDWKVARNLRLTFHDLATEVLAPLHASSPLARVECSA